MKKIIVVVLFVLVLVSLADAQNYLYTALRKDGTTGKDTLIGTANDTSGYINLYPASGVLASTQDRAGDPCFQFIFTITATSCMHDSIDAYLRVNTIPNLVASDVSWCVIDTFHLYSYASGDAIGANESVWLVCDTLNDISAPYLSWVLDPVNTGATLDSTKYTIIYSGDKGVAP